MHSLEPSFNTTGPLLRASSIWFRFVTSTSSVLLLELLASFMTSTSSDLLLEPLISVQPELKERKQKIAKMKSDFLKTNGREKKKLVLYLEFSVIVSYNSPENLQFYFFNQ